jgi:hypothetical protein
MLFLATFKIVDFRNGQWIRHDATEMRIIIADNGEQAERKLRAKIVEVQTSIDDLDIIQAIE